MTFASIAVLTGFGPSCGVVQLVRDFDSNCECSPRYPMSALPIFAARPKLQADFSDVAGWVQAKPGKRIVMSGGLYCRADHGCCLCCALDGKMPGNLTGFVFETVEGHLSILADLDDVAVGITHVAAPFPAVIV